MASLQSHKRRIKSIDSTSDIARAMELVSSVKLKKLKKQYDKAIRYLNELEKVINEVLYITNLEHKFNEEGENIDIVITSNLGLCGLYNEEILKFLDKENEDTSYIVFGEKGKSYLNNKKRTILFSYSEYSAFEEREFQEEFSNHLFNLVKKGKIKCINVIYTKYINNLKFDVVKETIYPFDLNKGKTDIKYEIEPNNEDIINHLISMLVKTKIHSVLLNSLLSENASRNNAMKNAKDNADELKKELVLVYNKLRQQQITNELSDIVNGM